MVDVEVLDRQPHSTEEGIRVWICAQTRRLSQIILSIPPWLVLLFCCGITILASYLFVHTDDGRAIRDWEERPEWKAQCPWVVGIIMTMSCVVVFWFGYNIQREIDVLKALNKAAEAQRLECTVRAAFSMLFPTLSGYLGAKIILHGDSYVSILLITASLFLALLVYGLAETFPAIDGVASLNVALAVKMHSPFGEIMRLVVCLLPGCLKTFLPELIDKWKGWVSGYEQVVTGNDDPPGPPPAQVQMQNVKRLRDWELQLSANKEALDSRSLALDSREEALDNREVALDNRKEALDNREVALDNREGQLQVQSEALDASKQRLREEKEALNIRKKKLDSRERRLRQALVEREMVLNARDHGLIARKHGLNVRKHGLNVREHGLNARELVLKAGLDRLITRKHRLKARERWLNVRKHKLNALEHGVKEHEDTVKSRDAKLNVRTHLLNAREAVLNDLEAQLDMRETGVGLDDGEVNRQEHELNGHEYRFQLNAREDVLNEKEAQLDMRKYGLDKGEVNRQEHELNGREYLLKARERAEYVRAAVRLQGAGSSSRFRS